MMKKSRLLLFGAMFHLVGVASGIIFDFVEYGMYYLPMGWVAKIVLVIYSIAIIKNSEVKQKRACLLLSFLAYVSVLVISAVLATFGIMGME
jgi:excinuclease UvrABC helicase subunit UvrB